MQFSPKKVLRFALNATKLLELGRERQTGERYAGERYAGERQAAHRRGGELRARERRGVRKAAR